MNCDNWNYLKTSKLHDCQIISVWGCFFSDRDFKITDEGLYSALMAIGIQIIRWYKRMYRTEIFRANKEATWLYKQKKKQNINLMWIVSLVISFGMTSNCLNYCSICFVTMRDKRTKAWKRVFDTFSHHHDSTIPRSASIDRFVPHLVSLNLL